MFTFKTRVALFAMLGAICVAGSAQTLTPTSLTFPSTTIGTASAIESSVLTNTGSTTISISSIAVNGADAANFFETDNCGVNIAAAQTCTISIQFIPSTAGARSAYVTVTDQIAGANATQTLALSGLAAAPVPTATVLPGSLSFTGTNLGSSSSPQPVNLSNSGGAPLTVSSIAVSGSGAANFSTTNSCGATVAGSANCTISVVFTPAAAGALSATLTVTDDSNGVAGSTQTVSLAGTGAAIPTVTIAPASLSFAATNLGASAPSQSISLTNMGAGSLSISNITVMGANAGDFTETNTCGANVAPGGSCSISVLFTPTALGTRTATLSLTDNAGGAVGTQQTLGLTGAGTGVAALAITPNTVSFANTAIGATAAAQSISLTDSGTAPLSINSILLGGANGGDFATSNNCGSGLAANGTCTVTVTFTPTATGSRSAMLTISDAVSDSPQTVALAGSGVGPPGAAVMPSMLAFGNSNVGTTSSGQTVTLSNSGSSALNLSGMTLGGANPGDFTVSNNCGNSVSPQASCLISVTFNPTTTGSRSATISITDNATGSPQTVTLTGTGVGVPSAALSPAAVNFGNINIAANATAQSVTLSNAGSAALNIGSIAIQGSNASDFGSSNNCGPSLGANSSCTIKVTFTPGGAGARTATLVVTDNAGDSSGSRQSASMMGTGVAVPNALLSPNIVSLGSATTGSTTPAQSIMLSNSGTALLAISNISISGQNASDFSTSNNCNGSVPASGSCTILVAFTPSAVGSRTATLLVVDNAGNATATQQGVPLSGTGIALALASVTPNSIGFSAKTAPQTVTLTNSGTGTLSISSIAIGGPNAGNFSIASNTCGGSLTSGSSCNITISFTAVSPNGSSAVLNIVDNANNIGGSSQAVTLSGQSALTISSSSLPGGTVGIAYPANTGVAVQGGTSPYSFSLSGILPAGLTFNNGIISGTPTTAGSSAFTVTVTDSGSPVQSVSQPYTLTVTAPGLSIQTPALSTGMIGTAYSSTAVAQGGTPPFTWSVASGSLPAGITLNAVNGTVSGTPSTSGTATFTLQVTDHSSPVQTATHAYSVAIAPTALILSTTSLPNGVQGVAYTQTLAATGGTAPYTWSIVVGSGLLPAGLTLNASTGVITGTPTTAGSYTFSLQATDASSPKETAAQQFTIAIASPPTPQVSISGVTFTGLSGSVTPGANITGALMQVNPAGTYPVGLSLAFTPDSAVTGLPAGYLGDAGFVANGGTKSSSSPAVNTSSSGSASVPTLDPGTVAGTLTITPSINGQTFLGATVTIDPAAPVIEANSVQITNVTSTGFDVEVVATSTTRDLQTATFTFSPAAGAQLTGTTMFSVDVGPLFTPWFSSSSGLSYGGAFSLTIPFTLNGSSNAIASVSMTLTNSVGTSLPVSGAQ